MTCKGCGRNKLSNEFPYEHLTETCENKHPLLHCLRCVTRAVNEDHKCSQCEIYIEEENLVYKKHLHTLEFLFPTITSSDEIGLITKASTQKSEISITTLSGERVTSDYDPDKTIIDLEKEVKKKLESSNQNQFLSYNDMVLERKGPHNEDRTLKDYGIESGSRICLLYILCELPDQLDKIIFDLWWGYPEEGKDGLDASVFLYSNEKYIDVLNFKRREIQSCPGVTHSGDTMDDVNQMGHHTIKVSLKSIPSHIDLLVFTLSAWKAPDMSKFRNLSLQFWDEKDPNKLLCKDMVKSVSKSQAVIMCFVTASETRQWKVFSIKRRSAGNAMDYDPLKESIQKILKWPKFWKLYSSKNIS